MNSAKRRVNIHVHIYGTITSLAVPYLPQTLYIIFVTNRFQLIAKFLTDIHVCCTIKREMFHSLFSHTIARFAPSICTDTRPPISLYIGPCLSDSNFADNAALSSSSLSTLGNIPSRPQVCSSVQCVTIDILFNAIVIPNGCLRSVHPGGA